MKKVIIGIFIGMIVTLSICIPIAKGQIDEKYNHGRKVGFSHGGLHVIKFLDVHFCRQEISGQSQVLDEMHFKDISIYIIKITLHDKNIHLSH